VKQRPENRTNRRQTRTYITSEERRRTCGGKPSLSIFSAALEPNGANNLSYVTRTIRRDVRTRLIQTHADFIEAPITFEKCPQSSLRPIAAGAPQSKSPDCWRPISVFQPTNVRRGSRWPTTEYRRQTALREFPYQCSHSECSSQNSPISRYEETFEIDVLFSAMKSSFSRCHVTCGLFVREQHTRPLLLDVRSRRSETWACL